jgi:hypothetical protein
MKSMKAANGKAFTVNRITTALTLAVRTPIMRP